MQILTVGAVCSPPLEQMGMFRSSQMMAIVNMRI